MNPSEACFNSSKRLRFISDFLALHPEVKRSHIARELGYSSAGGFNIALSSVDDLQMGKMYSLFELFQCTLDVELRFENDPSVPVRPEQYPEEERNVRALLSAMTRYNKTLKELSLDLGLFERSLSYYTQKGDIPFSKLCDIAYAEGWSVFVTIRENKGQDSDSHFHVSIEKTEHLCLDNLVSKKMKVKKG